MGNWPKPESNMAPEGHYVFRLREEPEFETWDFTDKKTGKPKIGTKIVFIAVGTNADGDEFEVRDNFPVWDARYTDLCMALGVEHGKDIRMAGAVFEGDVAHEPDKKNLTRVYARIVKIIPHAGAEFPDGSDEKVDDQIPF